MCVEHNQIKRMQRKVIGYHLVCKAPAGRNPIPLGEAPDISDPAGRRGGWTA